MGIINYLNETKKSRYVKRDYIELTKPVVNVFVGEFPDAEKKILMDTLSARVGNSKKIHYCEIKLGNTKAAVDEGVYLFPCSEADCAGPYDIESWNILYEQAEKSEGLKRDAMDFVKYVFNEASEFIYDSRGRIRINYIIQTDWIGTALLETLVKVFHAHFAEYYPNGVHTDLYCLLDQQGHNNDNRGEERKALNFRTLAMINSIVEEGKLNPAYIMSNYTSLNCLESNSLKERIETIALHMIIKDGKSLGDRQRRFSEENFVDAARSREGQFCTIGKLNLEVEKELRDRVVYKTLFSDLYHSDIRESTVEHLIRRMEVDKEHYEASVSELFLKHKITEQMLYPLVINRQITAAEFLSESHGSMVEKLYGEELNYFWLENFESNQTEKKQIADELVKKINLTLDTAYRNNECSLTEVYRAIVRVEQLFREYAREYRRLWSEMSAGFEDWEGQKCNYTNLRDTVKGTKTPRACYTLACEYLDKYTTVKQTEVYMEIAECCLREIQISANYYRGQSDTVKDAVEELEEEIREREQNAEKLLGGNMCDYYTEVTTDWMRNSDEYTKFYRMINNQICNRELLGEDIYQKLIAFCDAEIIPDMRYSDDIAIEMLRRLKNYENFSTEEAIYNLAFDTIMKKRKYYANHTEFGRPYEAVCLLVNPENDFVNSTNDQMNKLQRNQQLQWFFEEHYNGMDILFLEGCFRVNDIYQYDLYKRVNETYEAEI